ncbi:hypothetical protein BDV96DRAFT_639440 [Lophiotrema nucula]|uniref:Uncharacterized protein n=1 Tax=Lophiotrema nucula TaxID=690887 RepID=A0A6A5ZVG4_9PLEO|nr:hypothetical protein BDV96DRAFT_639440 [Lophiotrema nucula]
MIGAYRPVFAEQRRKTTRPNKRVLLILLSIGLFAFFFHFLQYLSPTTDFLSSSIGSGLRKAFPKQSFCTEEIGSGICCELHVGAEPCLNECRNQFVDRETLTLTKEYEECSDMCLEVYDRTCRNGVETFGGTSDKEVKEEPEDTNNRARGAL